MEKTRKSQLKKHKPNELTLNVSPRSRLNTIKETTFYSMDVETGKEGD